jgi:nucleotide-binding universal stress UspA family protein
MKFQRIVLTTDLSENANVAAPAAALLARKLDGEIFIVHVIEDIPYVEFGTGAAFESAAWMSAIHNNRHAELNNFAKQFAERQSVKATPVLLQGNPPARLSST